MIQLPSKLKSHSPWKIVTKELQLKFHLNRCKLKVFQKS